MRFEIYSTPAARVGLLSVGINALASREWRWRLRAANNKIIASGESYKNRQDCMHAVQLLKGTNVFTPVRFV